MLRDGPEDHGMGCEVLNVLAGHFNICALMKAQRTSGRTAPVVKRPQNLRPNRFTASLSRSVWPFLRSCHAYKPLPNASETFVFRKGGA